MTAPRCACFEFPSEPGAASAARVAVRSALEAGTGGAFAPRDLDEIDVVVQEACTNAVRHAHRGDPGKRLRVEVEVRADGVEIRVRDEGPRFDLTDAPPPDPELLQEGGYGVHIMRAWMDEVSATHDGCGNTLRLVRRFAGRAAAGGSHVRG